MKIIKVNIECKGENYYREAIVFLDRVVSVSAAQPNEGSIIQLEGGECLYVKESLDIIGKRIYKKLDEAQS